MLFIQKIFRKKGEMIMSIAVTGATGQLGGLVIQHLLKKV
ncbi:SDR family NAD(P)-dependent oxidoreductase, partial [Listeria monocytogenes]